MLDVVNAAHLATVARFAEAKGETHARDLWEHLWRLHRMFDATEGELASGALWEPGQLAMPACWAPFARGEVTMRLTPDWAPASFYFAGSNGLQGGLIYHGDQAGWPLRDGSVIPAGHAVDPLSVTLTPALWSIHT